MVGMDYSQAFIAKCQELKMTGQAKYNMMVEGELVESKMAVIDPDIVREVYIDSVVLCFQSISLHVLLLNRTGHMLASL